MLIDILRFMIINYKGYQAPQFCIFLTNGQILGCITNTCIAGIAGFKQDWELASTPIVGERDRQ